MPRATEDKPSESQLEKVLMAMVEQMRLQHEEMKTLFAALSLAQVAAVQETSKNQYDQPSKDVQKFRPTKRRYGPVIGDSNLPDSKKRDLISMKLDEDAYRKYADDVIPMQPHEINFETTEALRVQEDIDSSTVRVSEDNLSTIDC
ncbi:hypothetical protein ANCDUO_23654 [Ancylostoma duodenale]|uniref:Uncharacterized protein n=1 Tax=Ancylostoma duodenale TaxID=51022 RepID=A0A0C2C931_9BILA|nr:hypothetical protein ANCDUO_23654 [Ancylostoma duodenale]